MPIEPTSSRVLNPLYGGTFNSDSGPAYPFVLPGELVTSYCSELRVLEPSPDRVTPGCVHFGVCGGCHYQHAAYATQLELKREILASLLTSAGLENLPPIQLESGPEWQYRNRLRLRVEQLSDESLPFQAGYSLRNTNDFLPIRMCPIAAPVLWRAVESILHLAATDPIVSRWLALTSEIELFTTPDESSVQLQFFLRQAEAAKHESASFPTLCDHLSAALLNPSVSRGSQPDRDACEPTSLAGASATLDPELNRRSRRAWPGVTWGAAGLNYPAASRTFWLPRGAFFQVNRFLIDRLVNLVTGNLSGNLAWDLYAGVGLFTRPLADRFDHVVAVEGADVAAASLAATKSPKIEAVHSSTLDFLRTRALQRERPSLIVVDPPRAGIGAEAAALLNRIASPAIVYVSCDPTTLARDLAILDQTYRIDQLHLIDLFPQTFHMETVVHLSR